MYKCNNCEETFQEPMIMQTSYESLYGVDSEFKDKHELNINVCPNCHSEDISIVDIELETEMKQNEQGKSNL